MTDEVALRQIFERLGSIDARLNSGSRRHDEFDERMKRIEAKIEPLPRIAETVEDMSPIIADYKSSRSMMAGIMLALTTIAGGVGFFASELKALFLGRH
jgi:hypothetical protein